MFSVMQKRVVVSFKYYLIELRRATTWSHAVSSWLPIQHNTYPYSPTPTHLPEGVAMSVIECCINEKENK